MLTEPLSIIHQQSWLTEEVPINWKLAKVTPIYMQGWKENPGNCQPDLDAGKSLGADHLECHQVACAGQPGITLARVGLGKAGTAWPA